MKRMVTRMARVDRLRAIGAIGGAALVSAAAAAGAELTGPPAERGSERGTTTQIVPLDVTKIASWDEALDPNNTVLLIDLASAAGLPPGTQVTVTSIGWDVTGHAFSTSWASEMGFYLDDNLVPDLSGVLLHPLIDFNSPGVFAGASMGQQDLTDNGIANLTLPDGVLRLEAFESFDDHPNEIDGVWLTGFLHVGIAEGSGAALPADDCMAATPIAGLGLFPFDSSAATTDGTPHHLCGATGAAQVFNDVWWLWTSTVTGEVTLSTCGMTTFDARVAVYSAGVGCGAGSGAVLTCDSGCGAGGVSFYARESETYLIRLGNSPEDAARGQGIGGSGAILLAAGEIPLCLEGDCQALGAMTSAFSSDNVGFRVADDWTAPASGFIDALCFWGSYNVANPSGLNDNFRVVYYRDAGGRPGQPIAVFTEDSLAVTSRKLVVMAKATTTTTDIAGRQVFRFSVCHPPVAVTAGERCWVEICNLDAPGPWGWARAGSAGNGAWQDFTPADSYTNATARNDLAMCVGFVGACTLDANGDGLINFEDLNLVVSKFNMACP